MHTKTMTRHLPRAVRHELATLTAEAEEAIDQQYHLLRSEGQTSDPFTLEVIRAQIERYERRLVRIDRRCQEITRRYR